MRTLIKDGFVIDPANGVNSKLNLVIEEGKIAEVTREEPKCEQVIDAQGKYVVPGFIDIHMHEEGYDEEEGKLKDSINYSMLRMGVTTAIGGNCGDNYMEPADYLDEIDAKGGPINMGLLAGHTYFRNKAGHTDKYTEITDKELADMTKMMEEALDKGCIGVSFGIRYVPGINEKELLECGKLCRKGNKMVTAHVRNDAEFIFGAMQELINIGEKLNVPVQVSHVGSMGGFGQMREMLQIIDAYKANNYDVTADCYPYYAFSTRIGETTYDDGFLERYGTDYSVIEVCEGKYKGMRCNEEIFKELRKEAPHTITVCHVMKPEDVDMALVHPNVMLASDGLLNRGQGHPRAAGSFPRFIKNYVKTGKLPLYDAINKMTAMQAKKLGLRNKGCLNKGADADIVIFDLDKIEDTATFDKPVEYPIGIDYVLINGQIALHNNEVVNAKLGRSVRKF